jgi:hypothetical protein
MSYLSLTDLFLVGLALDITGAILLAKGLLLSPGMISDVSGSYWNFNQPAARDRCENRVCGEFGVAFLGLGFVLQVVGYSAEIGGASAAAGSDRLIAGLVMAAIAAGFARLVYRLWHVSREQHLLVSVEAETERRQKREQERKERERQEREAAASPD